MWENLTQIFICDMQQIAHIIENISVQISYMKYRNSIFLGISEVRFPYLKHRKFHISCTNSVLKFSYLKYTQFTSHVKNLYPGLPM